MASVIAQTFLPKVQRFLEGGVKKGFVGGKEINKYSIRGIKGYINDRSLITEKAKIRSNSILAQNIVAHITQPYEHIQIIACMPDKLDFILVDTINQITVIDSLYSAKYIWCLLYSKLINWYTYLFIFGKAIRTMHFDNAVTSRIPVANISLKQQLPFISIVDYLLYQKRTPSVSAAIGQYFEQVIDGMVCELYFIEEMTSKGIDIIGIVSQDLATLPDFTPLSTEAKQAQIESLYRKWTAPASELNNRLSLMTVRSPDVLGVILGGK